MISTTDDSAIKSAQTPPLPACERKGFWRRFADFALCRKQVVPPTFGGMSYDELSTFANETPPPQSWHEQDVKTLRGPSR
jgi:hypothetical protein